MAKCRIFTCRECGVVFEGKNPGVIWCSPECKKKSGYGTKHKQRCRCTGCGKELFKRVQKANAYCSNACQQLHRKKKSTRLNVIYWCNLCETFEAASECRVWQRKFEQLSREPKELTEHQLWQRKFASIVAMNRHREREVRRITRAGRSFAKRTVVTERKRWMAKFHGMARNAERRMIRKGLQQSE